jgi:hypothetical protein
MNTVADLSDPQLDAAFASCWDNRDFTAAQFYAAEIVNRLISPLSFLGGLVGYERFPLYDARAKFDQVGEARDSVTNSAEKLAANAADMMIFGAKGAIVFALVAVAVYAYAGRK